MNAKDVMELLEHGEANLVVTYGYLLRYGDKYYVSFDGNMWESTVSDIVKREFE